MLFNKTNMNMDDAIDAALQKAIELGKTEFRMEFGGFDPSDGQFGMREILPVDFDRNPTNDLHEWTNNTTNVGALAAGWNDMVDMTTNEDEIFVFFGFHDTLATGTIEITLIRFTINGNEKYVNHTVWLEVAQGVAVAAGQPAVIFIPPKIIAPNSTLKIQAYATGVVAADADKLGFAGYKIAKHNRLLRLTT